MNGHHSTAKTVNKTHSWKIPDKFVNLEFADFLLNTNDLNVERRPIKDSYGSVQEWSEHYQLWESHGITLDALLKLLDEKGCAIINKKENYVQYHIGNIALLEAEIRTRIKG